MKIEELIIAMSDLHPKDMIDLITISGGAKELLEMDRREMYERFEISERAASKLLNPELRARAEKECEFAYKNNIRIISFTEKNYPNLLSNCPDAPMVIYVKGDIDFNANPHKWLSFVGTRNPSTHGEEACSSLIEQLANHHKDIVIVSGLAYGIDTKAHRTALKQGLKTVAVVAHGLETIYPPANFSLAKEMVEAGGAIITEYPSYSKVFRHFFSARNRIVAGLSSGTVIVESPLKGGSMITANLANGYNRELFAIPGRYNDPSFSGCNNLIKSSTAQLIQEASDIECTLGWRREKTLIDLFKPDLEAEQQRIYDCFETTAEITADEITQKLNMTLNEFYSHITMLELNGYIKSLRGKVYIKR